MAQQSYLIGIAGPSGAGKSYLARHLAPRFSARVLSLDHYYRDLAHLSPEQRARTNFDDPSALEHELLITQVADLRAGRAIQVPGYDFTVHTRTDITRWFDPAPFVIVEGLFTLYWPKLRELLGTSVYVDMNDDICLDRRQERDVRERGRTPESVLQQFRATVAPMAERYVRPTRQHAHVVLSGCAPIEDGVESIVEHIRRQPGNSADAAEILHTQPLPSS
ncbi:MAG TPA: uridine kinase [Candidatus Angelobacter sp.]|jgi:uridine kinase|nr:uridine kinase [Candidatus Angelobacter sp.]